MVGDEAAAAEAPLVMDAGVGRIFTSKEAIRRSRPHRITAVEVEREGERVVVAMIIAFTIDTYMDRQRARADRKLWPVIAGP